MDFSDFEEIDPITEFGIDHGAVSQPILPHRPHLEGGHPPWQGHGGRLIGVVDMGR